MNSSSQNSKNEFRRLAHDYEAILDFLSTPDQDSNSDHHLKLPDAPSLRALFQTFSTGAPAVPDTSSEEWNPISQRPHLALLSPGQEGLASEFQALKNGVDGFTILAHEMMHVALWEPFFAGEYLPSSCDEFVKFSLAAEGFCYFYSDIVLAPHFRARFPDGELALARQTASSSYFHPCRAFESLGITDLNEILSIYLQGFLGGSTKLWVKKGRSDEASSLAFQAFEFYQHSVPLIKDLYFALQKFGGLKKLSQLFAQPRNIPHFSRPEDAIHLKTGDFYAYFKGFYEHTLPQLAGLPEPALVKIKLRRAIQMRGYYSLSVESYLKSENIVVHSPTRLDRSSLLGEIDRYQKGLATLALNLEHDDLILAKLRSLDQRYNKNVRKKLSQALVYTGERYLIAPKRGSGLFSRTLKSRSAALKNIAYLIKELATHYEEKGLSPTEFQHAIGGLLTVQDLLMKKQLKKAEGAWQKILKLDAILNIWALPLTDFNPLAERYRELYFSYQ